MVISTQLWPTGLIEAEAGLTLRQTASSIGQPASFQLTAGP